MPRPADLGLPPKFSSWRKNQEKIWEQIHFNKNRFAILNAPVGSGKSAVAMASALLDAEEGDEHRSAYLTVTKQLQEQVLGDFETCGMVDIRGRSNYVCNIDESRDASTAKCTAGVWCSRTKRGGDGPCDYYDQKRDAANSRIVLSNYAFWLHDEESQALGRFHRLILDEGHRASEAIEKFASVEITDREITEYGGQQPVKGQGQDRWKIAMLDAVQRTMEKRKPRPGDKLDWKLLEWLRHAKDLQRRLTRLCRLSAQEWLCSRVGRRAWRWELLNAGALAEPLLFRGASKVVLVSATVNRKTLELLGVKDPSIKLVEQDSTFPVSRRPIYFWPVTRVSHGMDSFDRKRWTDAIDAIITPRRDRKGLIHSVSYARALEIVAASKHRDSGLFVVHRKGVPLAQVVAEFKAKRGPAILVSPAASEGVDLPMDQCEYIIVPKMPFPDMRDPLIKAKKTRDKDYIPYIVLQHVVQSAGRGMRSADDTCECFILDDHFGWLKGGYYQYLPRWFQVALRTLPKREPPPAPLNKIVM